MVTSPRRRRSVALTDVESEPEAPPILMKMRSAHASTLGAVSPSEDTKVAIDVENQVIEFRRTSDRSICEHYCSCCSIVADR